MPLKNCAEDKAAFLFEILMWLLIIVIEKRLESIAKVIKFTALKIIKFWVNITISIWKNWRKLILHWVNLIINVL